MTQLPAVRMAAFSSASPRWNSSPASAATTTSSGSAITMPRCGSAQPKIATVSTMKPSGFQVMAPIGSPPSTSMVSALNSTMAPSSAIRMPRPKGK